MLSSCGLGVEQTIQLRDMAPNQNVLLGGVLGSVVPMYPQMLNPDPPLLGNVEFRRALLHAANRQQLSDVLTSRLTRLSAVISNSSATLVGSAEQRLSSSPFCRAISKRS